MKRKPIKIHWDELESAFDNRQEDLVYYLDLVTGQVILDGEGEEDADEREEIPEEAPDESANGRNETTRLYVEPPGPDDELAWMQDFASEIAPEDPALATELDRTLDADDPHESFRELLRHHLAHRDRWFGFRSDRQHETIDAWLDAHHVQVTEPPPWRS